MSANNEKIKIYLRDYLDNISELNINEEDFIEYRYLDAGHIDSFEIMHLIINIEQEFNIQIKPEDTESDNFRYIGGLISIIESRL